MPFENYKHKFPVVVDSSMRVDSNSCLQKYYLRHILGLAPISISIHLNAGGAYADALEAFRLAFYRDRDSVPVARAKGVIALIKSYGDIDFEPTEAKQWHRMVDAFLSYVREYPPATDHLQPVMLDAGDGKKKPAVEFGFALPFDINLKHPETGDPLLYVGHFDLLGILNGVMFGEDDKTTSRLGAQWGAQWDLRSQFTGYCWGAKQYDYPMGGFVIRGTGILKTKITHAEAIVYRPNWMIERWHERLSFDVANLLQHYKSNYWPHTGEESGACAAYSGCAYRTLCQSPEPERWVEGNFIVARWNPVTGKVESDEEGDK